jgi:deoxyadenosine/deoxycytidine kinase
MLYLVGLSRVLQHPRYAGRAVALDHGPAFQMAHLREFGPGKLRLASFEGWWSQLFRQWGRTLNLVVWLDAPDELLIERIRNRTQRHAVKTLPASEARSFLNRYRSAHAYVLSRLTSDSPLRVLRFSTDSVSTEQLVSRILEEVEAGTGRNGSRAAGCASIDSVSPLPVPAARDAKN